ncbi:MAG: hypothetical protein A2580_00965 [Hydrogenophilales bacterium RIFOXYD1_FULL_62_11]|nr:MAG: hypothetical protein A2580_00965 [Hydrogenophilales bacterium RIFOXYD1_FULL_62_11]
MSTTKRKRFEAVSQTQSSVSQIADTTRPRTPVGELLDVKRLDPDPTNARQIPAHFYEGRLEVDTSVDTDVERQEEILEGLRGLATGIEANGMPSPIVVRPTGDRYTIIMGHRRFLAHLLLGRKTIYSTIAPNANVKQLQFIENVQRSDLTLGERLDATLGLLGELEIDPMDKPRATGALIEKVGLGKSLAYRWTTIINGPRELHDAMRDGVVASTMQAEQLAGMRIEELLPALDELMAGGGAAVPGGSAPTTAPTSTPGPSPSRTKPVTASISLGRVHSPDVVKKIYTAVMGEDAATDVDWKNKKTVVAAFKSMLKKLEDQI